MRWKEGFRTKTYRFVGTKLGYREFGFMRYSELLLEGLQAPEPLTHMFSLARDRGCSFLIEQEVEQSSLPENEYEIRILEDLQRPHRNLNRRTYRVSFYRTGGESPPFPSNIEDTIPSTDAVAAGSDWFYENISAVECIGYIWVNVDRSGEYPISAYVAEAIIEPPTFKSQHTTESQTFIHCKSTYQFEILERTFFLTGSFFAQQEGCVWCCAHAAILSCLNQIHGTNGHNMTIERMNEILGIDHVSRFGRAGLNVLEIKMILEAENVPAAVHHLEVPGATREQILRAAYSSIEIGLPAIICFAGRGGHAMAVVGHTFDPSLWNSKASAAYFQPGDLGYTSSFAWVDKLVVQDDNFGPYQTVLKSDLLESVFAVVYPCHPQLLTNSPLFLSETLVANCLNKQLVENGVFVNLFFHLKENGYYQDNYWLSRLADAMVHRAQVLRQTTISRSTFYEQLSEVGFTVEGNDAAVCPEELVIVEISIPELYQWNHRRLGEAHVEKQMVCELQDDGTEVVEERLIVKLIRLPGVMIVFDTCLKLYKVESDIGRYHREIVMNTH